MSVFGDAVTIAVESLFSSQPPSGNEKMATQTAMILQRFTFTPIKQDQLTARGTIAAILQHIQNPAARDRAAGWSGVSFFGDRYRLLQLTVLSVTTFWSFQREFSRRTGRNVLNSIQLIDLPDPGTKMGPWKPKHARRRHTTTVSRSSCVRRRILRVPFDTESLDQRHATG
ncbi:hypothetical protein OAE77_00670 [bacterium]|nr:hypothetical protein [bacterium]